MSKKNINKDYKSVLSAELLRRVRANPAYSMRRFAQQLGLSPATLSGVLSGKRKLSLKTALEVAERLSLPPAHAVEFCQSASSTPLPGTSVGLLRYRLLSEEIFEAVSEWHHYAILEATYLKGARTQARWFAGLFGINYNEAVAAMTRLQKLGLLKLRDGAWVKTDARIASSDGIPFPAVRKRHRQVLEKAIVALEETPVDERDSSSMTMAIDPSLLPEAKRRIGAFRRELCEFLESGSRKRVYEMSIQLFPLSKKEGTQK